MAVPADEAVGGVTEVRGGVIRVRAAWAPLPLQPTTPAPHASDAFQGAFKVLTTIPANEVLLTLTAAETTERA